MLGWGAVMACLALVGLYAASPHSWPIQASRATELRDSLAMIKHGGPLLLGRHPNGQLYAVGVTDDQGLFVYIPWLSHVLGVSDPVNMLRYLYIALFTLTAGIYPFLFWRLTGSTLAGLAAPLLLLACVRSIGFNDLYWIPAWGILTLLPIIFLMSNRWPARIGVPLVAALGVLASLLTSMRSQAGLPIVLALATVIVMQRWRWWQTAAVIALLAVAYISVNTFVIPAVRAHRDDRIGTTALSRDQPSGHPFWHTAYIGLGYLPNSSKLHYRDQDAAARVEREAPGARFLSGRYATTLRKAYFRVITREPGEWLRQNAAKALVMIADAAPYLVLVALTLPALLLLEQQGRRRRWLLLTLPALVITLLPALIAIPFQIYEEGLYGILGLVAIVALTWMIQRAGQLSVDGSSLRQMARSLRAGVRRDDAWGERLRRAMTWSAAAIAATLVLAIPAHFVRREAERWLGENSGVLIDRATPAEVAYAPLATLRTSSEPGPPAPGHRAHGASPAPGHRAQGAPRAVAGCEPASCPL